MVFELSLIVLSLLSSFFYVVIGATLGYFFLTWMYSELLILALGAVFFKCSFFNCLLDFLRTSAEFSDSIEIFS